VNPCRGLKGGEKNARRVYLVHRGRGEDWSTPRAGAEGGGNGRRSGKFPSDPGLKILHV